MKIFGSGFSFPLNKLEIGYELRRVSWQKMCNILRGRSANHTTNCTNFLSTHWTFLGCWIFFKFQYKSFFEKKKRKSLLFLASDMRRPEKRGRKTFFFIFSLFCCDCEKQSPRLFCYRHSQQNWNRKSNYWRDCPTRHWKAISMTVGIGGHLWPHALSWHEVALAIACQFQPTPGFPIPPPLPLPFRPPSPLQQALLPGSLFLFLLPPPKSCSPSLSVSDHADRLSRGRRRGKHTHAHTHTGMRLCPEGTAAAHKV